jgi:hypothetical protein
MSTHSGAFCEFDSASGQNVSSLSSPPNFAQRETFCGVMQYQFKFELAVYKRL